MKKRQVFVNLAIHRMNARESTNTFTKGMADDVIVADFHWDDIEDKPEYLDKAIAVISAMIDSSVTMTYLTKADSIKTVKECINDLILSSFLEGDIVDTSTTATDDVDYYIPMYCKWDNISDKPKRINEMISALTALSKKASSKTVLGLAVTLGEIKNVINDIILPAMKNAYESESVIKSKKGSEMSLSSVRQVLTRLLHGLRNEV